MYQQPIAGLRSWCCVPFFLSHAVSVVYREGDLGDEVDGRKRDTIKLLSDDDGSRKRGVPCGHLARQSFFSSYLFLNLSDGQASFRPLDDNGCVISFDETAQMLSLVGVDGALERTCLLCDFEQFHVDSSFSRNAEIPKRDGGPS